MDTATEMLREANRKLEAVRNYGGEHGLVLASEAGKLTVGALLEVIAEMGARVRALEGKKG